VEEVRALLAQLGARLPPAPLFQDIGHAVVHAEGRALAAYVDLTLLAPEATSARIAALCREAVEYGCRSVCVNPAWVELAVRCVSGAISVCSVAGFPLGATTTESKCAEAVAAIAAGASEVDMVAAIGWLAEGLPRDGGPADGRSLLEYQAQIDAVGRAVRDAVGPVPSQRRALKVILETCLLDDRQKIAGALLAAGAGADFVKTSTGFSTGGATPGDVALLRAALGTAPHASAIKASGGIRDAAGARALLAAGATRLGCSSSAVFGAG